MFTRKLLGLISVLAVISGSVPDQQTYFVRDSSCCSECKDFHKTENIVQNNSIIIFCSERVEISSSILLENHSNLTLQGHTSETVLECTKYGAGLTLIGDTEITIKNLRIVNCGCEHNSTTQSEISGTSETVQLSSAVYFINCSNVRLENINVSNSHGLGLVLYDTSGTVEVLHSVFSNNSLRPMPNDNTFGGGGVYAEFTVCTPGEYCTDFDSETANSRAEGNKYLFRNCTFTNNKAYFKGQKFVQYTNDRKRQDHQGLGRGGGLSIQLNGRAKFNTFTVDNCTFHQNEANWGGGLYIIVQDSSSHNIIQLSRITVDENRSKPLYGGGGVDLGFNIATISNNSVQFEQCRFLNNIAGFGGGVRIYSSQRNESELQNLIEFRQCEWINNTARFGSAIDIAPHVWEVLSSGFLPVPLFHNCVFRANVAGTAQNQINITGYTESQNGRGAMMLTRFKATFSGLITFIENSGSAVYLSSSIITTSPLTTCHFERNSGFEGGAIAFIGFSALFVTDNNTFYFLRNTATRRGGALFSYNIDKHNLVSSRSCFIQYHGLTDSEDVKNVTFEFVNNSAGYRLGNLSAKNCYTSGYSIFSSSLMTCIHACDYYPPQDSGKYHRFKQTDPFKCVGKFTYIGSDIKCQVSTSGGKFDLRKFNLRGKKCLELYPGREKKLNVLVYNDFNQSIDAVYYASLESSIHSNLKISQPYSYISNQKVRLHGTPGSTGMLKLRKLGYREITLDVKVSLLDCPPGYILDKSNHSIDGLVFEKCVCSSLQSRTSLKAIPECNKTAFRAKLQKGYWLGFHDNRIEYGYCPSGHCANMLSKTLILPQNRKELEKEICGKYRTGRLCGRCRSNYSVHYHGITYWCETNDSCKYGWLLYIISELLPLTVLFVIATVFNISFTSGSVNGFIWFAQMVHSFPITGKSFIVFPNAVYHMYTVIRMVYDFFNFDFFTHDKLSFCLWRGATTLDMLVFKFVTVVYAIVLVLTTIGCVKHCNIFRKCKCFRFSTVKSSIIHGLSSVLVIVFSQCFKVCCRTLEMAYIFSEGNKFVSTVVFLQGDLTPFSGDHIKYAIPAIFCMLLMIIPMLLLLIYPLNFKFLKIIKCSDSNPVAKCLCHTPYSKLKPFLDSFQSSFKDDYRVFAGLYFVYRILIIFTILIPRLTQKYVVLDGLLVVFLLIHAIAQPYRERVHNIIDGLLFFNLIAISKVTAFNYSYSKSPSDGFNPLPVTTTLAILLLSVPLLCMLLYVGAIIFRKVKSSVVKRSPLEVMNDFDEFELPDRDEESDSEGSVDYQPFRNVPFIPEPYHT